MPPLLSVVIPFQAGTATTAASFARALEQDPLTEVVLAGSGELTLQEGPRRKILRGLSGGGVAIQAALPLVKGSVTVLQDPVPGYSTASYGSLTAPIHLNLADVVYGTAGKSAGLLPRVLSKATGLVTDQSLREPLSGQRAFRTEALRSVQLSSAGDEIDAELVVKLAAQLYRFTEVPVLSSAAPRPPLRRQLRHLQTLWRYAAVQNDADNLHEGYNTLARMESAPRYNAWIGEKLRAHCGKRVLEIGAGIGTITAQLEKDAELLIALEVDPFYVNRLKNRFRDKPHVRPYLSNVELADWQQLKAERLDTIVLSNVLEHIEDDGGAVQRFRQLLGDDGRLALLVPALPQLFGSMDEAVGHYRRYTPSALRALLEGNGFAIERLEWMNLVGIPGWFLNGRVMKRRAVPPLQLRAFDQLAPLLASAEALAPSIPVGMSLFAVARRTGDAA